MDNVFFGRDCEVGKVKECVEESKKWNVHDGIVQVIESDNLQAFKAIKDNGFDISSFKFNGSKGISAVIDCAKNSVLIKEDGLGRVLKFLLGKDDIINALNVSDLEKILKMITPSRESVEILNSISRKRKDLFKEITESDSTVIFVDMERVLSEIEEYFEDENIKEVTRDLFKDIFDVKEFISKSSCKSDCSSRCDKVKSQQLGKEGRKDREATNPFNKAYKVKKDIQAREDEKIEPDKEKEDRETVPGCCASGSNPFNMNDPFNEECETKSYTQNREDKEIKSNKKEYSNTVSEYEVESIKSSVKIKNNSTGETKDFDIEAKSLDELKNIIESKIIEAGKEDDEKLVQLVADKMLNEKSFKDAVIELLKLNK